MIGLIVKLLIGLVSLAVVLAGIGAALVYTGSPKPCSDRDVAVSGVWAVQARDKWDSFKDEAVLYEAFLILNESEVTSIGVEYLEESDVPIEDIQVYFCEEGYAEAAGRFTGGGPSISVRARGTLDFAGPSPNVEVSSVRIGNLPGFLGVGGFITRITEDARVLDRLDVRLTSVKFSDGEIELTGLR